ncbi:hypothetical protein AXI64_gp223 [Vibrio phage qdvp001]|uniref:hypothetical protein n=1 Tax=Vibrio phage qdvp001 TaxID=1003177 RepID=UPI00071FCF2E|nr:hypothetical protein AXI64_gp223 [Vibrio phage qdvp001]ALM62215.1 hypothetical protein qdvp001_223 [Vibrio phage qdvp001]
MPSKKEFKIINDKYTVLIGDRGGVEVYSNYRVKPLKVYGKKKDGVRFVNLTVDKIEGPLPYDIEHIKESCLNGSRLQAMTEEEVKQALKRDDLPELLDNVEDIESLERDFDRFGNVVYIDYLPAYHVFYNKVVMTQKSNGFEKFFYRATINNTIDNQTISQNTKTFTNKDKVIFSDVTEISDQELESIFKIVNEERKQRKLKAFHSDFSKAYLNKSRNESINYKIYQEDTLKGSDT